MFASSRSASQILAPELSAFDRHLAIGRTGDLYPAVGQVRRYLGDRPNTGTDLGGLREEVQRLTDGDGVPPPLPLGEQFGAPSGEAIVQICQQVKGARRQDLLQPVNCWTGDGDPTAHGIPLVTVATNVWREWMARKLPHRWTRASHHG